MGIYIAPVDDLLFFLPFGILQQAELKPITKYSNCSSHQWQGEEIEYV
jgi:hypothetical protein